MSNGNVASANPSIVPPNYVANAAAVDPPTYKPEILRCCPKCYRPQCDLVGVHMGDTTVFVCYDCQITIQQHWMPTISSVIVKLAPEMEVSVKQSEQLILLCKLLNNKACL